MAGIILSFSSGAFGASGASGAFQKKETQIMFDYANLLVGVVPLVVVIFGLVEFSKSMGLSGKALTIFSLLLGCAFGSAYKIAESGLPASFAGWFALLVFGLALGLVASGFYDFANKRFPKTGP
jgi:hypothetical protein